MLIIKKETHLCWSRLNWLATQVHTAIFFATQTPLLLGTKTLKLVVKGEFFPRLDVSNSKNAYSNFGVDLPRNIALVNDTTS